MAYVSGLPTQLGAWVNHPQVFQMILDGSEVTGLDFNVWIRGAQPRSSMVAKFALGLEGL
jgi:hypothetical protein